MKEDKNGNEEKIKERKNYISFWPILSVISQDFKVHVALETYVIVGNDAILKCEVPSFVTDLIHVMSWVNNEEQVFLPDSRGKKESRMQKSFHHT